jgi:inorganic triphosphatase YgiF
VPAKEVVSSRAFESEIALIIKDNSDHIRTDLAGTRHVLEYDLKPKPSQVIQDRYYDTKGNFLRQKRITLRIRRIDGTLLLSTKSDIRRTAGNIIQRREIERPWSHNSIRMLARNLNLKSPTMSVSKFQTVPVSKTLATMGLEVIQERRTQREPRDIVNRSKAPVSILAELAIDYVTYVFGDIRVGLSEIEVEAKAPRSLSKVRNIADALVSKYRPSLQQWFHGKFLTGLAIQRLLKTRALQNYLVNGDLGPKAFKIIDRSIQSRGF